MLRSTLLATAAAAALSLGFATGALAAGDTLRIAGYDNPAQMGMPYGTFGANGAYQLYAFFDPVTFVDMDRTTKPSLITNWEARGATSWVLKLRPNVKFHNGKPWNADAFIQNVDAINNDPIVNKQQGANQLRGMKEVKKIDDLTVEVVLDYTDPIFPRRLHIMRPHEPGAWKDLGAEFARKPVGTGPYKNIEWSNQRVRGESFAEGWRPAKIKNLEILTIPENAGRLAALNSGQADLAWQLEPDAIPLVEAAGNKVMLTATNDTLNLIPLHMKPGTPLADKRVRQALNYAYDKDTYISTVLRGAGKAVGQPAGSPMSGHFDDIKPYPYDVAKAKQLLAEAGYPNGFKFVAEIVTTGEFPTTVLTMSNDFKKIGVDLEVRNITTADFVKKVLTLAPWEGDAFAMMYEGHPSSDIMRVMGTHSCMTRELSNREPHTCHEAIMPTIKAMNVEMDPKKRDELAKKAAQFYHDEAVVVFSHERVLVDGLSPKLTGYRLVNRWISYADMQFTK
jgi:peptide/nickel transport system substrate-binding protein